MRRLMRRTPKRSTLAALPLAMTLGLALALTGCGADGGGGSAAGGKDAGLSQEEKGAKFAECMRENGIEMEDPEPGKGIALKLDKGKDAEETMNKAREACSKYSPVGKPGGKPPAELQEQAREHAECMRENGVEAFPDPDPEEAGIRITPEIGEDPDFEKAQKECSSVLGAPGKGGAAPVTPK